MQARFCARALPPPFARACGLRSATRRHSDLRGPAAGPAATFGELVEQLDALVKDPNPPRNYGDALAKEELRNVDYRDLTMGLDSGRLRRLRQRTATLRQGQFLVSESASGGGGSGTAPGAVDASAAPDELPFGGSAAIDLGLTKEQKNRRRIWMTKIAGYKDFRNRLLLMEHLLDSLDESRGAGGSDLGAADQGAGAQAGGNQSAGGQSAGDQDAEAQGEPGAAEDAPYDEDAEFEALLRQSLELAGSHQAGARQPAAPAQRNNNSNNGGGPFGTRSFHTTRRVAERPSGNGERPAAKIIAKKKGMTIKAIAPRTVRAISRQKRVKSVGAKGPPSAARVRHSLVRPADMPTSKALKKHALASATGEDLHIPIVVHANVGDIVDVRSILGSGALSRYSTGMAVSVIVQKTTGRFHYSAVSGSGAVGGTRAKTFGFISRGLLFDKGFLLKGGVSREDAEVIMRYGDEIREYMEHNGEGALTSEAEATRLQLAQNQKVPQPATGLLDDASSASVDLAASAMDYEGSPLEQAALDEASQQLEQAADRCDDGDDAAAAAADAGEEDGGMAGFILRTAPRAVRAFEEGAERLVRSHYRELNEYWSMAISQGQTRVTVDALAELIFGLKGTRLKRETARLAAYMHLSSDPMHFVPCEDFLFYTQVFELRPRAQVEEIQAVRDMIRQGAPEFTRFIDKARRLVAFSYAQDDQTPMRTGLSPDLATTQATFKCDVTGWRTDVDFGDAWCPDAELIPSEDEVGRTVFNEDDRRFIAVLQKSIDHANFGYAYTRNPYAPFAPAIVKKIGPYLDGEISTVARFLVDIGVHPHWHNPRLDFRSMRCAADGAADPLGAAAESSAQQYLAGEPDAVDEGAGSRAADEGAGSADSALMQTSSGVGVIDKTRFYGRDICEDIRHDFGDLPVYTIDDAATRDVDDGISLETAVGADGKPQEWVHIHVADPTALIHPGHVAAASALERTTSVYLAERTTHMLPFDLTLSKISLARRDDQTPTKTLTFSARIGDDGEIVDYKVRPGLVRNITAVPYELADNHLSFEHTPGPIGPLDRLKDMTRHGLLVHPFSARMEGWRHYGENCGSLPDAAVQTLRALQTICQRHTELRLRGETFNTLKRYTDVALDFGAGGGGSEQVSSMARPLLGRQPVGGSCLAHPVISTRHGFAPLSPAHLLVTELMVIACRVAARYAGEHGRGVPMIYRTQEPPNLDVLSGGPATMPTAFSGLGASEVQSAAKLWGAAMEATRANHGFMAQKYHDEVRHMLNVSVFTEVPGPHASMGICDEYGYTRVTSPIRRVDDLVGHWQLKAQLLAERGDGRDRAPWFWSRDDIARLAPIVFRKQFMASKRMTLSYETWSITMVQRMEFEARRGTLALPPDGYYDPSSPSYRDNPFAYYDPRRPGPLVWTATVDNRDETRIFIVVILEGTGAKAMLVPRPLSMEMQPLAGTKVRVQVVAVEPMAGILMVKLAPEEFQPAETPRFWSGTHARSMPTGRISSIRIPPAGLRAAHGG
ncbi:3'-5' RNA exonuclease complex component [Coemansia javaensis]|uniref:3'-5' RNA exonuclease complex component n=1 Tax=Coemansia javaensis TaxID=2761396 RepID=A0A9W8HC22_9FUNG|nr:3'-5' RNA exonuclease complex component [Coemansia javaensis]